MLMDGEQQSMDYEYQVLLEYIVIFHIGIFRPVWEMCL